MKKIKEDDDINNRIREEKDKKNFFFAKVLKHIIDFKYSKMLPSTTFVFHYYFFLGMVYIYLRMFEDKIGNNSYETFWGKSFEM